MKILFALLLIPTLAQALTINTEAQLDALINSRAESLPDTELDVRHLRTSAPKLASLLALMPQLTKLNACCSYLSFRNQKLPANLSIVNLERCEGLTDYDLLPFSTCPLIQLNLSSSDQISASGIKLLQNTTTLTHLDLGFCKFLGPEAIAYLKKLPLKSLSLASTLTDDASLALLAHLPLIHLDCTLCDRITTEGLRKLASPTIETLILYGCKRLETGTLDALAAFPVLRKVDLRGCPAIRPDAILDFASSHPEIEVLF